MSSNLGIEVLASCHGPGRPRRHGRGGLRAIRRIPQLPRFEEPGQDDLEAMLAAAGALADAGPERGGRSIRARLAILATLLAVAGPACSGRGA